MGEEELSWCSSVRIWSAQHDLHLQVLDTGPGLTAPVVRGSVQEEDDPLPPLGAKLLGEDQSQLREEYAHDVLIRVWLGQRQPDVSL